MKESTTYTISKLRLSLAGALILVTAFVVGASIDGFSDQLISELPSHTDSFEAVQISDGMTPMADQKVRTTSSSSKKTVKIKKKSKKTYTKYLPDQVSTRTTVKENGDTMVETKTTVKTEVREKYKKRKKKKTVYTTVTTTVVTTTYTAQKEEPAAQTETQPAAEATPAPAPAQQEQAQPETQPATEAQAPAEEVAPVEGTEPAAEATEPTEPTAPAEPEQPAQPEQTQPAEAATPEADQTDVPSNDAAPALPEGDSKIKTAAPQADANLLSAFDTLGFTFTVDANYQFTGVFDARTRNITLRYNDDNVYHELGHFLAFAAGNYDASNAFKDVYNAEKSLYNGRNASYVLKDSSEYFAESYRDYVLNKSALQSQRPQTYAAIETALGKITDTQLKRLTRTYASIWK